MQRGMGEGSAAGVPWGEDLGAGEFRKLGAFPLPLTQGDQEAKKTDAQRE
jgi:hypothetical protein